MTAAALAFLLTLQVDALVGVDLAGGRACMRVASIDTWSGYAWLVSIGRPPQWVARFPLEALSACP